MPVPKSRLGSVGRAAPILQPTQPKPAPTVWLDRKIKVRLSSGAADAGVPVVDPDGGSSLSSQDKWLTVEAEVYGTLALHEGKTESSRRKWAVTHVLCGLLITHMDRKEDARRVAEWLWANYKEAVQIEDHHRSARMIPEHVKAWLRRCRTEGRWLEPGDFLGDT